MTAIKREGKPAAISTKTHPSDDNRFKILEATMKRHQYQPDALIEVLHKAQELFGYLSDDLLITIAQSLKLPSNRVYGVATSYHSRDRRPLSVVRCCEPCQKSVQGKCHARDWIDAANGRGRPGSRRRR